MIGLHGLNIGFFRESGSAYRSSSLPATTTAKVSTESSASTDAKPTPQPIHHSTLEKNLLLIEVLQFLSKHWLDKEVGLVAACVKDGDKVAFATSTRNGTYWKHAERNAIEKFQAQYGHLPSKNSLVATTLSPCIVELKYRKEESCTKLCLNLGITNVFAGVLDTMHTPNIEKYKALGLTGFSISEDIVTFSTCLKLMNVFGKYDSRINSELLLIKQNELGKDFFAAIDSIDVQLLRKTLAIDSLHTTGTTEKPSADLLSKKC